MGFGIPLFPIADPWAEKLFTFYVAILWWVLDLILAASRNLKFTVGFLFTIGPTAGNGMIDTAIFGISLRIGKIVIFISVEITADTDGTLAINGGQAEIILQF